MTKITKESYRAEEFLFGWLLRHPTAAYTCIDREGTRWTFDEIEARQGGGPKYWATETDLIASLPDAVEDA